MNPSTTSGRAADRRGRVAHPRRRPPSRVRRPGLYLGAAAAGALLVNVLLGAEPGPEPGAGTAEPVSVAAQLGVITPDTAAGTTPDLRPLEQLAASRSSREAAQTAAQQAQAAADQAVLEQQQAEAEAAARAAAEAAAARAAAEAAATAEAAEDGVVTTSATPATSVAQISNRTGKVQPQAQAAANAVVSNVPGAAGITIGGTRASAADPGGHPSGLALDYMVMSDDALGDAIAQYQIEHWDELGVEYVIWQQRMLSSPNGSWKPMEDRGGVTENHFDHVHVNYLG